MRHDRKIGIAFLLNLGFSVFEFIGGAVTGSVAIASDAIHDLGDTLSIGIAWLLERKSGKKPDARHSFGYGRYSVVGGAVTTLILLVGSVLVMARAVDRMIHPVAIDQAGMLWMAAIGVAVNVAAAWFTRDGTSVNQRAVNLHMLEDVLGWIVVLVGAVVMRLTGWWIIDPLLSILVALYILFHAAKNMRSVLSVLTERTPVALDPEEISLHLNMIYGVVDIHHLHIWSISGGDACATMHVVTGADSAAIKHRIRDELRSYGITHAVLELEMPTEVCQERECAGVQSAQKHSCHHYH